MSLAQDRIIDRLSRLVADRATGVRTTPSDREPRAAATPSAATPPPEPQSAHPSFLFAQSARGGTFLPNDATPATPAAPATDYTLTLDGHVGSTVFFSNRPDRIFGHAPTDQFLASFDFSPVNPPNAAVVTTRDDGTDDVLIVTLTDPAYDPTTGALSYGANVLADYVGDGLAFQAAQQDDLALPERLGATSVLIDDCSDLTTCVRFTGRRVFREQVTVGPLPGAPVPRCWTWLAFSCIPCEGTSNAVFSDLCNVSYPDECHEGCVAI